MTGHDKVAPWPVAPLLNPHFPMLAYAGIMLAGQTRLLELFARLRLCFGCFKATLEKFG